MAAALPVSRIHRLGAGGYRALVERCEVIESDSFGEKLLRTPDDLMVKIFRRKRWLTTAMFSPYAWRFVRNVRRLAERGITTVTVLERAHCPELQRHLITYRPLPGLNLRVALHERPMDSKLLLAATATFVAMLHRRGIFFRSLHFGNIIVAPVDHALGLIDVADLDFCRRPLSVAQRVRNFRHLRRYREDFAAIAAYGWTRFFTDYLESAALPTAQTRKLEQALFADLRDPDPTGHGKDTSGVC